MVYFESLTEWKFEQWLKEEICDVGDARGIHAQRRWRRRMEKALVVLVPLSY